MTNLKINVEVLDSTNTKTLVSQVITITLPDVPASSNVVSVPAGNTTNTSVPSAPPPPPSTVPLAPLRATVNIQGTTYIVDESLATNLGSYNSLAGGFTQTCKRFDIAALGLSVFFRSDTDGKRDEVVFELGRLFYKTPMANLGPYTVTILRGQSTLATITVPNHYWFSRWRWQSARRPIIRSVDTLIKAKLLPPYQSVTGYISPVRPSYSIMGLAGITPYMPQTGERDDIGLFTEAGAEYLCTRNQAALDAVFAQAEASGTIPWHKRDEITHTPADFNAYPNMTWYDPNAGTPYIPGVATPITIDMSHEPNLAYLPFLLTDDPYYLEEMQFATNDAWGALPSKYRPDIPQTRMYAWYMRNLGQCVQVTPASTPSWLFPKSYWQTFMDKNRLFLETNYVNDAVGALHSVFHSTAPIWAARDEGPWAPAGSWIDVWQQEFLSTVLGYLVDMGFSEWKKSFDWCVQNTLDRTSKTSGWHRAFSTPYRILLKTSATSPIVGTWADAWLLTSKAQGLVDNGSDTWLLGSDKTYLSYTRGSLVYAERLNPGSATENLTWASTNLGAQNSFKWRIG